MKTLLRVLAFLCLVQGNITLYAQKVFKPSKVDERIDLSAQFNGKDRPYLLIQIPALQAGDQVRMEAAVATKRDSYEITNVGSKQKLQPAEVYTLGGGIALFGNYEAGSTYKVAVLRNIPCFDDATHVSVGEVPSGDVGQVKWTLQADTGLDRKRVFELIPGVVSDTNNESSSAFQLDFKTGVTRFLGENGYLDVGVDGNVATVKESSLNQIEGRLNFGYRWMHGKTRMEFTNKFQSTQNADQMDYAVGAQAAFLPPLAISWFSRRFAWDPTIRLGYERASEIRSGTNDTVDSSNRLTYGLHWVIPIIDIYAFSVDGTGMMELRNPGGPSRFHDTTKVAFHILLHEVDEVKVETVFSYVRGEAAPSFQFNQGVVLGMLLMIR